MEYIHYYTTDGFTEKFTRNIQVHKDIGPAGITYDDIGNIQFIEWYINNKQHRINKPSYYQFKNGYLLYIEYAINGQRHNETGPAQIWYTPKSKTKIWRLHDTYIGTTYKAFKFFIFKNREKYSHIYKNILKKESINIFN